jgi:hypothetical protein
MEIWIIGGRAISWRYLITTRTVPPQDERDENDSNAYRNDAADSAADDGANGLRLRGRGRGGSGGGVAALVEESGTVREVVGDDGLAVDVGGGE